MENNEENLGSQEPTTTTSSSVKPANTKLIGIIAIAVVVLLAVFFMFFTRSAKSTVKDYIKAMGKYNANKVFALMDFEGAGAFEEISHYSYEGKTYDYDKFDESYDEIMDKMKDMDKDQKKAYEELKDKQLDSLKDSFDKLKDSDKKIKYSVKNVKSEKVDGSKKLTKVTCDITVKVDDKEETQEGVVFYTMKKGLKNYIVSAGI